MHYRQLGRSGLFVSEFCLGTMNFGGEGKYRHLGSLDEAATRALVEAALEAGINFFDSADVYSAGKSETLLGQALRHVKRSDVVVATKVFGEVGNGPNDRGASRGHIMDGVKRSLERLQLDHIDLYQIHGSDMLTPIEETLRALDDLVSQGLVRYVGVSNWPAWRVAKGLEIAKYFGWARLDTIQAYYSVVGRGVEREIVPLLNTEGLGLLVWSPLAGGLLTGKYGPGQDTKGTMRRQLFDLPPVDLERAWPIVDAMRRIAGAHETSVVSVALAWLLARPGVTSVIIGARHIDQLRDNLAATELVLTEADMRALDEISALPSEYPGWMLKMQQVIRQPPATEKRSVK
jgi:aryl-alcohol dehydrogenase-like predicted oxidoreductase